MGPLRLALDCALTPLEALRALGGEERPFALVGRWAGSQAILGWAPTARVDGFPPDVAPLAGSPDPAFVGGGWFGWLGYALGAEVERLPPPPPRPAVTPAAELGWYPSVLRLDAEGTWWFEALEDTAETRTRLDATRRLLARPAGPAEPWRLDGMTLHGGGASAHRAAVADCVERIAAGELFQANLCVRLDGRLRGDACDAFAAAAAELQPAYGAFFGRPDGAVLSFSPELFLRRRGRAVETAPIKGTAPRTGEGEASQAARDALVASAKDAAEHVMIVDLMRNDLGRVAEYGAVAAAARPDVEAHPGVWHLVSRVRATLREGVGDEELLHATFPPGSVTGAPKVQALKVISALEGTGREAYTGAIGFVSPAAGLELNVAIRTLEVRGEDAWLGCGGGIVADSDPEGELREALGKAAPILSALGARVPSVDAAATPAAAGARGARRLSRPDPALGVFETVAVRDGRAVALDLHLQRLATSVAELYDVALDVDLGARATVAAAEAGEGPHRLRITVIPSGWCEVRVSAAAPAGSTAEVELDPVVLAGGLGAHKWVDRTPVDGLDRPGHSGLIVDLDGAVLEASTANVWIVEGERLVTPPADGRLLGGVTRARLLAQDALATAQEPIDLDRLRRADAVLVTSSLRLSAPAALAGHEPTATARDVAARLRAALLPAVAPTR